MNETVQNEGVRAAANVAGSVAALARMLNIKPSSIWGWHNTPAKRVLEIERLTGVPRTLLRPDLYPPDEMPPPPIPAPATAEEVTT